MDTKYGVINEQGFLGEGFGFTEASEEDAKKIIGNDTEEEDKKEKR